MRSRQGHMFEGNAARDLYENHAYNYAPQNARNWSISSRGYQRENISGLHLYENDQSQIKQSSTERSQLTRSALIRQENFLLHSIVLGVAVIFLIIGLTASVITQMHQQASMNNLTYEAHSVVAGDTLWTLAQNTSIAGLSTDEIVLLIAEYNNLDDGGFIHPGETVFIPVLVSNT